MGNVNSLIGLVLENIKSQGFFCILAYNCVNNYLTKDNDTDIIWIDKDKKAFRIRFASQRRK